MPKNAKKRQEYINNGTEIPSQTIQIKFCEIQFSTEEKRKIGVSDQSPQEVPTQICWMPNWCRLE